MFVHDSNRAAVKRSLIYHVIFALFYKEYQSQSVLGISCYESHVDRIPRHSTCAKSGDPKLQPDWAIPLCLMFHWLIASHAYLWDQGDDRGRSMFSYDKHTCAL